MKRFGHRHPSYRGVVLILAVLQTACGAGWKQPSPPRVEQGFEAHQQVQVWRSDESLRLHGVVIDSSVVTGVPFLHSLECDTCRISVPLATVDSIRIGNPTGGFLRSVGLTLGVWLVVGLLLYGVRY